MCLYPKLLDNRKYKPNKKNGYKAPPKPHDPRVLYVPVGCGRCIECRKQKSNAWRIRLAEEIRHDNTGVFVTLTFSEEKLNEIKEKLNKSNYYSYEIDNEIASYAVRHFLELWRKHHKKSVKHWLITELGHNNTERIHLHGILFTDKKDEIKKIWKYGYVYLGDYMNEKTINYVSKYITKTDIHHKEYQSKIFCSKGIGSKYLERDDSMKHIFDLENTNEEYRLRNGQKISLPIYYRNKVFNETEREELWLQKLNKNERYVLGIRIDMTKENSDNEYHSILKDARLKNYHWGYGNDEKNAEQKKYEEKRKKLKQLTYISAIRQKES